MNNASPQAVGARPVVVAGSEAGRIVGHELAADGFGVSRSWKTVTEPIFPSVIAG
jgi:hypothetical protein